MTPPVEGLYTVDSMIVTTMRRIVILLMAVVAVAAAAQVQQGYVKTRGRLGANGSVIAGSRLSGVTVKVLGGNAVVSGANGAFTMRLSSGNFFLQSVSKRGYVVCDPDVLKKQYSWSAGALVLVMEDEAQRQADINAATRKIRRSMEKQLHQREAEIDALNASNQEKELLIARLYEQQDKNDKLIKEMAERYSSIDYDQVDEFNRMFDAFVQNGELTRADSLLRTRRSVEELGADIDNLQAANAEELTEARRHQQNYEQGVQTVRQMLEEYGTQCYQHYELCLMSLKQDSAAYWLEVRADKDTTNAEWQFDAAYFLHKQNQFDSAGKYYERALEIRRRLAAANPQAYEPYVASTLNNLAILYSVTQRYQESERMYQEALEIRRRLAAANPQVYKPDVATTLNELAYTYMYTADYVKALATIDEAIALAPEDADLYDSKGEILLAQGNDEGALAMWRKVLELNPDLLKDNPDGTVLSNGLKQKGLIE